MVYLKELLFIILAISFISFTSGYVSNDLIKNRINVKTKVFTKTLGYKKYHNYDYNAKVIFISYKGVLVDNTTIEEVKQSIKDREVINIYNDKIKLGGIVYYDIKYHLFFYVSGDQIDINIERYNSR